MEMGWSQPRPKFCDVGYTSAKVESSYRKEYEMGQQCDLSLSAARTLLPALFLILFTSHISAQDSLREFAETKIDGWTINVDVPAGAEKVVIPNFHAPMRDLKWESSKGKGKPELTPLVDKWQIKFAKSDESRTLKLELGGKPLRTEELTSIKPRPDGGFDLPAHLAHVVGKKLRYETQPWKNTVGYWVVADDYAYFILQFNKPGKFNVGILQGCGKGQGGSDATISLHGPVAADKYTSNQQPLDEASLGKVDFQVEETGHFQNFKWRHVGELSVATKGIYAIKVAPRKIAKGALMDVRAISLTPIPK